MLSLIIGLSTAARYLRGRLAVPVAVGAVAAIVAPTAAAAAPAGAAPAVIPAIKVGMGPLGVVTNPLTNTAYVANVNDNTVSVISGKTNTVTAIIPVGTARQRRPRPGRDRRLTKGQAPLALAGWPAAHRRSPAKHLTVDTRIAFRVVRILSASWQTLASRPSVPVRAAGQCPL